MKKKMILMPIIMVGFVALFTWAVMLLWNGLIPDIFNGVIISFWQAAGLLVLSKMLFGGFRTNSFGGTRQIWKQKFRHKWRKMSVEEKMRWETKFASTMGSSVTVDEMG